MKTGGVTGAKTYCITGIDTDIGKTVATGLLAASFRQNGIRVITQKLVQTGCTGISEDILKHRQIMGIEVQQVDYSGLTCPYVFPVPCSPHLAAKIEDTVIDCDVITNSTEMLLEEYDIVLLEGAGGLMVPINEQYTLLDYLEEVKYPIILVSSSRLGSINHTLSALELARYRAMEIAAIIYNRFESADPRIEKDSRQVFANYLKKYWPQGRLIDLYPLGKYENGSKENNLSAYLK